MAQKFSLLLIIALFFTAGCGAIGSVSNTGQTSNDANAVQQFFPEIPNYSSVPTSDIQNAISTVTGGASLATGNILGAAAINRLNSLIDCYREVGALDARVYTQVSQQPVIGALAILNQDRAGENLLPCVAGAAAQSGRRSSEPEPCVGSGSFRFNDDTFLYLYAASDPSLCQSFDGHFRQYGG